MSVTASTLSAIQQAGQAIDVARLALAEAVKDHAQRVMMAVADQPFSVDNDKLFASWKAIARMAQEVHAIEEQFKTLYQTASALVAPETTVLKALPQAARSKAAGRHGSEAPDRLAAEDVEVKPQPAAPKSGPQRERRRAPGAPASAPAALSGNDAKLLDHLKGVLNGRSWTRVTQSGMASGAGIPTGSIGAALRRLVASGRVREGEKGRYRLA